MEVWRKIYLYDENYSKISFEYENISELEINEYKQYILLAEQFSKI